MGRVETRMYRQKRQRVRFVRWMAALLLLMTVVLIIWQGGQASFLAEQISLPTPRGTDSGFDRSVVSREVTLPAETWYAIQTGVFSTEEAALQKADTYAERGAPGTVIAQGEKWRVFIACYGTENEAAAVRTRLENNQKVETYLYTWECPELRLRLSGMAGQLDAAEAGFTLLSSTAAALRDTAVQLDAAQLTVQETIEAAGNLDRQICLWEDTVSNRFGKSVPALVEGMLRITDKWSERYEEMKVCKGATELSAALKTHAMGMYDEIATWRREIAAQ